MAANPFAAFDSQEGIENPFARFDAPEPKRTFGSDARNALMQGVQQLPGAATGLADIGAGAMGFDRPFSRTADRLGEATGFQPSKWAKDRDALYSDETKAANAEIDHVWKDPSTNAMDVAGAYARNPRASALTVLRSVPSMVAGATVARGAGVALPALSAVARAALGEGTLMAGQQMDTIDPSVDPQRAAAAAATTGIVGGTIGAAGGKIAARMGVRDIDTALAGGAGQAAQQAPGLARRVATGVVQEGLVEEGSQSAVETAAQNWAERKPLTEGMARNVTEGAIAGGIMGGGVAALPRGQAAQVDPQDASGDPALPPDGIPDGPASTARPSEAMGIDPAAGPMSRAAAESVDSQPDRLSPEEVRAFNNAYRRDVPDPLGELQQQVQTGTAYTSPDQVAEIRGEIEDAWLQSNAANDTTAVAQDAQSAPADAEIFGDATAEADARLRDRRIMSAVQNVVDGAASNGVAAFGYLDAALERIGEAPLSLAERARVRRVLDATAGFTGRTERAPLPADPVPQGDLFAQNDAMEALIPERRTDAVQPAGAGQQQAATPAPSASFATYEDAEAYIAEQRRAGGMRMQALPLPRADGSVGLALRGTPDYQAAQFALRDRQQRAAGVLDGDVLSKAGEIFSPRQKGQARMVAARLGPGYAVASVQGGFVARRIAEPNPAPDAVPAQAVQATRSAAAAGGAVDQDGRANTDATQLTAPATADAVPAQAQPLRPGLARMQAARAARDAAAQQTTPQRLAGVRIDREWTAFAPESGSKGIPRAEMPQIRAAHRGAMVQFLKGRGIGHAQETVAPGTLKPTQAEFSPRKVARAGKFQDGDRSILVSADGHVLDGHHQWIAKLQAGQPVDVIRLDAPIEQLIDEVRQFPSAAAAAGATQQASVAPAPAPTALASAPTPALQRTPAPAAPASAREAASPTSQDVDVTPRDQDTGSPAFSRSAMKSVEANIQRGRAAMNRVLLERTDVHRAMHRSDLGWIDFIWGDDKKGVQHILRQRQAKDGMTALQVMRMLTGEIVTTIAQGESSRRVEVNGSVMLHVDHGAHRAVLVKNTGSNAWMLTAFEKRSSGDRREGFDSQQATHTAPTPTRRGMGADDGPILPPALSRAQIQGAAAAIARRWTNGPEVIVAANMQDPVLPARIRDTDAGQRSRGAGGTPQGVYFGGKVYLISGQLRTERDVATVLFHEVLGHHGLRAVFGDALQPILSQLATMRRADVEAKAAAYGLDLSKPEQRLLAAEEVLADMAQTRPQIGWVQRAVAAVRTWLRANVPGLAGLRLSDAEIVRSFLAPARGFVERGGRAADQEPAERIDPVFSRTAAAGQVFTDLKRRTGNTLADYRHLALSTLGRRQLVELYGNELPQMQAYSDMVQQMDADKNDAGAGADRIATDWGKLKDEQQLADLMHDATLEQIDPAKPFVPGDNQTTYLALKRRYDALTPEARKVYAEARDTYRKHHEAVRTALRDRIERSALRGPRKAELLQQMDSDFFKAIKGVYFPLARFGQYVVVVRGADGKAINVSRAETLNEAEALRHTLRRVYPDATVGKVLKAKEFNAGRDAVGRGFMEELYKALGTREMDEKQRGELEDMLGQLYLSALPDLSWAKHGIHRKGTPGYSQDARRAFAQNVFHGARYLAKVRYSDLLDAELSEMQKHVDGQAGNTAYDSVQAQQVLDEMVKRHDAMMNPDASALSTALTSLGFVFHLGLSPASAAVNLTQTAFVALPIMGAKWGFAKASAALLKASKQTAANKNDITSSLTAQEREAYDEAVRSGVIDVTMAHDLAGISQGEDAKVSWKLRPVMRWASFLFHHAEKFNRQVTFVAAYRLAREVGTEHHQAYAEAVKATYDGHFDYSSSNRPRVMQGNVARVVLLFKQYAQNMIYTLSRQAFLAVKAEQPAARAEARKALGGLLAMHAAGAGILGLPLVTTLLAAASAVGGSDDEPWDAEVALRNMLADAFGQKPAEVLARGLSRLTPSDISGRVGLDKLILPDIQEGLEGQRLGESAMAAALGPVAGIGISLLKGLQEMADGNWVRGLETMAPSAVRGPLKAMRYADEGVVDRNGKAVLADVSGMGILGQAMGFSPSDVRLAYEGNSAIYQADQRLVRRRAELMRQFSMAKVMGDEEAAQEAQSDIQGFNTTNPDRRITAMNLAASIRLRRRKIEEAEQGIYLSRARRGIVEEGQFAVQTQ